MAHILDVREATRQLSRHKTAVVLCADGELCFLRDINESEAVAETLEGGHERRYPPSSLQLVTGYDSDEDGLMNDQKVTRVKRQRTSAGSGFSSSSTLAHRSSAVTGAPADPQRTAVEQMLCKAFTYRDPPYETAELERSLRLLEKFELVCQGDDFADPECMATNSEALMYARARAVVKGLGWSLGESLACRGREGTIKRLEAEPFLGWSNATKIVDIFVDGTCQRTLSRFQRGEPPISSDGKVRTESHRHAQGERRLMSSAPAKLELSTVLGVSAITASRLVDDAKLHGGHPIRSIAELRARPDVVAKLHGGRRVSQSLECHEDLQEPVPAEEAQQMLQTVQEAVRTLDIPHASGWQVEFVGGGRTRGKAGHDVDLLLSHMTEMASFMTASGPVFVLQLLLEVLVERGLVLPKSGAYFSPKYEPARHQSPRPYLRHNHMANETSKGFENLHHDHHDKFFGIWRSARTQRLHRIDIVICSHPDELPFARLAWTGTRTLNRLMRLRAIHLGLYLGAHCLVARGDRVGTSETEVVVDARPGRRREVVTLQRLEHLPFQHVRSEEDILRVLACGTDDFIRLVEPTNRNA